MVSGEVAEECTAPNFRIVEPFGVGKQYNILSFGSYNFQDVVHFFSLLCCPVWGNETIS
jgi:hypothetical protein